MHMEVCGLGAAKKIEVAKWLGFSRNGVEAFLDDMGVAPVCGKYPWLRLIEAVVGLVPDSANTLALTEPLMSLADAAAEIGIGADRLKAQIEDGSLTAPPMYVFGDRRRRFIRHQFLSFVRTPRGDFPHYDFSAERFCSFNDIASKMRVKVDDLTSMIANGAMSAPPHVIVSNGKARYFNLPKYVLQSEPAPVETEAAPVVPTAISGGVLGFAARNIRAGVEA